VYAQKSWHKNGLLDLAIVITIIEELVETITSLLGLRYKKKIMTNLLTVGFFDVLDGNFGELLDEGVVDDEIVEVHNEQIEDLVIFEVVAAHLVEGKLRLQDVVT
jgi:hypothetical protein